MKVIPNYISFSRIILSLILIYTKPLSSAFYVIYIICGFSDIVDGFIARKTGAISSFGAKLDSLSDMIMAGVLLIVIYPIVNPTIEVIIWVVLTVIIRFLSMVTAFMKYKTFASIHTYANKITGIILFIFPMLLPYINTTVLIYITCSAATLSAIEELIIQMTSKQLQLNKKSIFQK